MRTSDKSILIIIATLVVGGLVGAFTTAAVNNHRMEELKALRHQEGFISAAEEVIGPVSAAQRAQLRPVLEHTAARRTELSRVYRDDREALLDSMRAELAPLLSAAQRSRLERWCGK